MFRSCLTVGLLTAGLLACARADDSAGESAVLSGEETGHASLHVSPRRIVSLVPVATEILFSLGAGERVVGRSRWDDYPPEALLVPDVGDAIRPSVERVLMRDPDLVIVVGGSDNAMAVQEMERLGVPFVVVTFNTLTDLEHGIHLLGELVGRQGEADMLWGRIHTELRAVESAVAAYDRPTVYYDVGYPPAFTVGAGSYLDTLISIAGGRNVFHDVSAVSPQVSLEAILGRDPDLIIHPVGSDDAMASLPPGARPGWTALRAVQERHVRRVSAPLVHRLGPRLGAAARVLALAIHPELSELSVGRRP